ncbi:MAG: Rne/Rng family ribonuclease [Bdellovibrio sp.]|nr:MAG: Rne/Rng family ribonuclease [Bdellovibrio sp.]
MASEILINCRPNETRVAYVESGILSDLKVEQKTSPTMVGSIHRGRVIRVLPGMQAAFVDIGLEKAAFLYVGDIRDDLDEGLGDGHGDGHDLTAEDDEKIDTQNRTPIQDLLREGQHILVQVAKDPIGTKGARLTTHISLPGRFVVYLPTIRHRGISRRIESEEERDRLRGLVAQIDPSGGVIVRTAGEGAPEESLRNDIDYLDRLAKDILKQYEKKKSVGLIHQEIDVELRSLRDLMSENVSAVWVDEPEVHKKVVKFVSQLMPKYKHNIVLYQDNKPLFDMYDIDLEISRSMDRKIWLKSGGYIVIDEAEALVVVDVNTGKFVGKRDLEETILKTNLEAVREIAHQLRIRNCGGIIIVDFIDMERESHREKVLAHLAEELRKDRARTNIVSMTPLGLVEMTRKRIRPSLIRTLCEPCAYCEGRGYIRRKSTVANEIFRELERDLPQLVSQKKSNILVHCHGEVVDWIYEEEGESLSAMEAKLGRSVTFKIEPAYHREQYEIFIV